MNKAIPYNIMLLRLAGIVLVCLAVPPLLGYYLGPVAGVLSSLGAASVWFSQYRFPAWNQRSGTSFWFVVGGYALIGITLLVSLGRLMGVTL